MFTRAAARTGERVGIVQPVRIGRPRPGRTGIVVYLIPVSRAPSGTYTTLVWCRPCGGTASPHGSVFAGGLLAKNGVLNVRR